MTEASPTPGGQRDPREEDLAAILTLIWEGASLRKTCLALGLHTPSTSAWLHADPDRQAQYMRAREGRAEFISEDALELARAAATGERVDDRDIDPAGVRVYVDAAKWRVGQMAPKMAPVENRHHTFGDLPESEIDRRIAALSGGGGDAPTDEG